MRLRDLITDAGGQTLSHSKLWSNLACAAATFAFLRQAWVGSISAEIWLAYLGCVGGATVASKYLSLKFRQPANAAYTEPGGPYPAYPPSSPYPPHPSATYAAQVPVQPIGVRGD